MEKRQSLSQVVLGKLVNHLQKNETRTPFWKPGIPFIQLVKNLPAMQETLVQFLGMEKPLEKG